MSNATENSANLNTLIVLPIFCKTSNQRHTLTGLYSKVFILASNGVGDKFIIVRKCRIAIVKSWRNAVVWTVLYPADTAVKDTGNETSLKKRNNIRLKKVSYAERFDESRTYFIRQLRSLSFIIIFFLIQIDSFNEKYKIKKSKQYV